MTELYSVRLRVLVLALFALFIGAGSLTAQWTNHPDLPAQRVNAMSAVAGGKLYVFGGLNPTNGSPASEAWVLDLSNPSAGWGSIQGLPENRAGGYAAAYNGKVYILAGVGVDAAIQMRTNVLEYDPALDAYTSKAAMQYGNWFSAGAVSGTKVYIIGGLTRTTQNVPSNVTQIYDLATDTWSQAANLPAGIFYGHAAALGSDVYFFGGQPTNTQITTAVLKMTGGTGSWASVGTMGVPVFGGAYGVLNGKAYVAGGTGVGGDVATVQTFDGTTWGTYYSMPVATSKAAGLASDGTSLYIISGTGGRGTYQMDIVDPKAIARVAPTELLFGTAVGGTQARGIAVSNLGVTNLNVTISIPGDATWLTTTTATMTVAPATGSVATFRASGAGLAPGAYTTTVTLTTNDEDNPTITIPVRLYVAADIAAVPTKIIFEESTGAWCGPCGLYGTPAAKALGEQFGDRIILIAYHHTGGRGAAADQLATSQTEGISNKLGVTAFPTAAIQRWIWNTGTEVSRMIGVNVWPTAANTVLTQQPNAPASLEVVEYAYNPTTRRVTAKVKVTTSDAFSLANGTTMRITAVALEDSVYHRQYTTEWIDPYYHYHVARSFHPNIDGLTLTPPAEATAEGGTVLLPGKEFTVDMSWQVTGVANAAEGEIAFLLHLNNGEAYGNALHGQVVELTGAIPNAAIEVAGDVASKTIPVDSTATFTTTVRNLTDAPMSLDFARLANTIPSGWTSQLCVGIDCADPATGTVNTTILPGTTQSFHVKIFGGTPSATGSVQVRATAGDTSVTFTYTVNTGPAGGIDEGSSVTGGLSLSAFPNPTAGETVLQYQTSRSADVTFDVFSSSGERVLAIDGGRREIGSHSTRLDLTTLPAGVYRVVMTAGGAKVARTVTVVR